MSVCTQTAWRIVVSPLTRKTMKSVACLSPVIVALWLAGCGGGSVDSDTVATTSTPTVPTNTGSPNVSATKSLVVSPSLGKISNASVRLINALTRQELATRVLDNTGKASFDVPSGNTPLLIEVIPSSTATYFDEGTGTNQPLGSDFRLRAALTGIGAGGGNIGVTPLTEAAVQRAEGLGGLTLANIAFANQSIGQVFGLGNVLHAPTLVGKIDDFSSLVNDDGGKYALLLAGLALSAKEYLGDSGANQPAVKMALALAADLADGRLDKVGLNLPLVVPYELTGFAASLEHALRTTLPAVLVTQGVNLSSSGQVMLNNLPVVINPYLGAPGAGSNSLCRGGKTLGLTDLSAVVGSYTVDIRQNTAEGTTIVQSATLNVASDGMLTLGSTKITALAVCQLVDSAGGSAGISVVSAVANRVVSLSFGNDKTVFGDDFSSSSVFRFISNATLIAPPKGQLRLVGATADLGALFDPTPKTWPGGIVVDNQVLTTAESTTITWNALQVLATLSTQQGEVPFRTVSENLKINFTTLGALKSLSFGFVASNLDGVGAGSYALADACASSAVGCLPAALGITINSSAKEVTFNKTKLTDGKNTLLLLGTLTY